MGEAISFIKYFENILQGKKLLTPVFEFMTEEPNNLQTKRNKET